jgi:predicted RNA binding protein YcfA (HicA-like mRNA interferase family)
MPPDFDREIRRLLTQAGCTFVRDGKGSHEIWRSPSLREIFRCQRAS